MSELHHAVQDELAAHRPDRVPPFAAVRASKRSRDRRRLATGGAALSAVAVAAVAVVVPSLAGDGPDRLPSYAEPAGGTATTTIDVRFRSTGDGDQAAVEGCVRKGVLVKLSLPAVYATRITATPEQTRAIVACLNGLPNVAAVETDTARPEPPSPPVPDGRAIVDRRPAAVVLLDVTAKSAPAGSVVDVAGRLPERNLEVVVYRSRGAGECATVTGPLDTQALCRPSLRQAVDDKGVVLGAVGPTVQKDGPSDPGGKVVAAAFAWGAAPEAAVRVRLVPRNGGDPVEVPTSTRAEWPGLSFFGATVDLGGTGAPAVIEGLDAAGEVVATADW